VIYDDYDDDDDDDDDYKNTEKNIIGFIEIFQTSIEPARNKLSIICSAPPEDEQVMLESCRGP
jgi:hypothetical protein